MLSSVRPAGVPLHFLMHRLHLRLQRGSLQAGLLARCDIVLFHVISSWSITPYHLLFGRAFLGCSRVITPNWTNGASLIFVPSRRQATCNVVSDVDLSVRGVHRACTPFFVRLLQEQRGQQLEGRPQHAPGCNNSTDFIVAHPTGMRGFSFTVKHRTLRKSAKAINELGVISSGMAALVSTNAKSSWQPSLIAINTTAAVTSPENVCYLLLPSKVGFFCAL